MSGAAAGGAAAGGEQSHRNAALVAENVQLQKEIARMRHALGVKDADNARLRADVKMQAETQQQMLKELDQMAVDWRRDVLLSRKVWNAAIAVTRKRKGRVFAGEDVHGAGAARPSSAASQNNQKHRRAAAVDIGPSAHPRERERERERAGHCISTQAWTPRTDRSILLPRRHAPWRWNRATPSVCVLNRRHYSTPSYHQVV